MRVQNIQSKTTFSSVKNPIKAEKFIYKDGFVIMREAEQSDLIDVARDMKKWMSQRFRHEFCMGNDAKHREAREMFRAVDKNKWLNEIKQHLADMLKKDDKSSVLVAKNQDNELVGYATMESMAKAEVPTGIIENIHLDNKYRDGDLGMHLLEKITATANNQFDEVVAGSYSLGDRSIYRKAGYKFIESEQYRKFLFARYSGIYTIDFWLKKKM